MVNLSFSFLLNNASLTAVQVQQPLLTDFVTNQRGGSRRRCRLSSVLRVGGILAQTGVLPFLIIFLFSLVADAKGTSLLPPHVSSMSQTKNDIRRVSHVAPVGMALAETQTEISSNDKMKNKKGIFSNLWRRLRGKKVCKEITIPDLTNLFKLISVVKYFKVADKDVELAMEGYRAHHGESITAKVSSARMRDDGVYIQLSFDWQTNEPTVLGELLMTCKDPKTKDCHRLDGCDFPNDTKGKEFSQLHIRIIEDKESKDHPVKGQTKVEISFEATLNDIRNVVEKP